MEFVTIIDRLKNGDISSGLTVERQQLVRINLDRMHALLSLLMLLF